MRNETLKITNRKKEVRKLEFTNRNLKILWFNRNFDQKQAAYNSCFDIGGV
jgi:hypothetical protein